MQFIKYNTESRKQNGCLGAEWLYVYQLFTFMVVWLTGSSGSQPLLSIMREYN